MPMPMEMGKNPNFTDSEWLKNPKMDSALRVYKEKAHNSISLDSRFVNIKSTGFPATLSAWSTSLIAIESHCCPKEYDCSSASLFIKEQHRTRA